MRIADALPELLDRALSGQPCALISDNYRALWPTVRSSIPWYMAIPHHRYKGTLEWGPYNPFRVVFISGGTLTIGPANSNIWLGPVFNCTLLVNPRSSDIIKIAKAKLRVGPSPKLLIVEDDQVPP